jgi:hypothetical protein
MGCGQEKPTPDVSGYNYILWEGNAFDNYELAKQFDSVSVCMEKYGFPKVDNAHFKIVDVNFFYCGKNSANGCYADNTVWVAPAFDTEHIIYELVVINDIKIEKELLRHEIIHRITGRGVYDHGTYYMQECSSPFTD